LAEAHIHPAHSSEERVIAMERFAEELRSQGRNPYVIPVGGSNEVGSQGYVLGFEELENQLQELPSKPTVLVFCSSSGGTHAGNLVGKAMTDSKIELLGIRNDDDPGFKGRVRDLANALSAKICVGKTFRNDDVQLNSDYVGEGYGVPSKEGKSAMKELWQCEGILLDPVYTAKAMAGLIDLAKRGEWVNKRIVFLHTGGIPSVFNFLYRM